MLNKMLRAGIAEIAVRIRQEDLIRAMKTEAQRAVDEMNMRYQMAQGYPVILNGDHAEYEIDFAASGRPIEERSDWPLPSFAAPDWAKAFCKIADNLGYKDQHGAPIDEGWMIGWFSCALMRGYDQHRGRCPMPRGFAQRVKAAWMVLCGRWAVEVD